MAKSTKVVISNVDYLEVYSPFQTSREEMERQAKIGILSSMGMSKQNINMIIDDVQLEFVAGADGEFDDQPYTPVRLVRTITHDEPEPIPVPKPDPIPEPKPEDIDQTQLGKRNTMLQHFFGDRGKEKRRRTLFSKFKSHIGKETISTYDEDGKEKKIEVWTVKDYAGKEDDADELMLSGYQTRLERLSRAHQGDFSPYKREYERLRESTKREIVVRYQEMHEVDPVGAEKFAKDAKDAYEALTGPDFERRAIQALIDGDTEFLETNNYQYNSLQNTALNLETLGKAGEASVKTPVSDELSKLKKLGLHTMNAFGTIRNFTIVPINKALGTYVVAPIYRTVMGVGKMKESAPVEVGGFKITPMEDIIAMSQKRSRGTFENKPTHRYQARKNYFVNQERAAMAAESSDGKKTDKPTLGKLIRLAIVPRFKAIVNYKEGNQALLNAGLHDIEQATDLRTEQLETKKGKLLTLRERIGGYDAEIKKLKALEKVVKDPVEKAKLSETIAEHEARRAQLHGRFVETSRVEVDSVATNPFSMSDHDKANKSNVTHGVRAIKTAVRIGATAYISKYLYEEVMHEGQMPDTTEFVEGKTVPVDVPYSYDVTEQVPGMGVDGIKAISLKDLYGQSGKKISYYANGLGNEIDDKTSHFRGLKFDYDGELFSGSDGKGFDPTVLTDIKLDQALSDDTSLVSVVEEILEDKLGKSFTTEEVARMIGDGKITGIDLWRSGRQNGIPDGWSRSKDALDKMLASGTHEVTKTMTGTKTMFKQLPGYWVTKPGETYTYTTQEVNEAVVAAMGALWLPEFLDDPLRHTRSQRNIGISNPQQLNRMAKENERNGAKKKPLETVKKGRAILAPQRTTKSKHRFYNHESARMHNATLIAATREAGIETKGKTEFEEFMSEGVDETKVFTGFTGTRKDLKGPYNENAIGVNTHDDTEEII